uniref:Uncharacterized protein n=1 Tax=Glossina morsitans morsitans TaxID=37546 RepID=A0A1B0G345_GLOMM
MQKCSMKVSICDDCGLRACTKSYNTHTYAFAFALSLRYIRAYVGCPRKSFTSCYTLKISLMSRM